MEKPLEEVGHIYSLIDDLEDDSDSDAVVDNKELFGDLLRECCLSISYKWYLFSRVYRKAGDKNGKLF